MMGTRAAAFAGKISNMRESLLRIQNGTMPQPTCIDLANMIKYFCQVFHDFRDFKDIENIPLYASEKKDRLQLIKTLPNFDYCGLYNTLSQLVDILPLIQPSSNGLDLLGGNLLMLFKCLVPFLDQANMETMPYLVTTLFMSLPTALHKDIMDTLCFNLLPFTIDQQQRNTAKMMRQASKNNQRLASSRKQKQRIAKEQQQARSGSKKRPVHCVVRIEDPGDEVSSASAKDTTNKQTSRGDSLEDQGIGSDTEQHDDCVTILPESDHANGEDDEDEEEDEYAALSVTSILAIAFHFITDPMHHSQLVECLMKLKNNVFEDLLFVIAHGTTRARCPAVEILFRYWPDICPSQQDRKNNSLANKLKHVGWLPTKCQNKDCSLTTLGDDEAVKMCLDFKISITLSGLPPPMLICLDCVDSIYKQQLSSGGGYLGDPEPSNQAIDDNSTKFIDLLLPMERVSKLCENKKCQSTGDRTAIGTCFDIECANYNSKRPIRYCKTCFINIHEPCAANDYDVTLQNHIRHSSLKLNIMENEDSVNNFVEAIISLLKEAAPADRPSKDSERYLRSLMGPMSQFNSDNKDMSIATEEKQLISQYGIWLMTGLCKTVDKISDELLGRLLGMLFQWFHFTACLPDDQAGSALEKLKGECIKGWIMSVKNQRLDVFISCLLPHPIDCSKIGGHWEVWPDTAHQIKEGFKRLLCLVPYDIITDDVWDEIMPYWMECFRHEVPENELSELKILLSKVFDPELSPLGFETKQMYNFISSRFEDSSNTNQEQTLYWLQIITMLEIPIPIDFLFRMLKSGVKSLASIRNHELNRMRIANRLAELDKLPGGHEGHQSSGSSQSSRDHNRSNSISSTSSSSSIEMSQPLSAHGDDVARSSTKQQVSGQTANTGPPQTDQSLTGIDAIPKAMTQQERQARARATFSARVLQQASLLDAGNATDSTTNASASAQVSSQTVSVSQPQKLQATAVDISSKQDVTSGEKVGQLGQGTVGTSHSRPLKAAAAPLQPQQQQQSKVASKRDQSKSSKPKLKLELSQSVDASQMLNKIDNNLVCYILMMDILLKQLDLQEINSHQGLYGREAQQAIGLLNDIISTPWIGRHTCCDSMPQSTGSPNQPLTSAPSSGGSAGGGNNKLDPGQSGGAKQPTGSTSSSQRADSPKGAGAQQASGSNVHLFGHCAQGFEQEDSFESCVFCEIISTFHQLAMFLIEFFAPVIEVSICEVSQDAANGEFDGAPDYSRIGLDHLGPSPKDTNQEFDFDQNLLLQQQQLQQQQDPTSPFSPSYMGPALKAEVLSSLPKELQLCYNLLVQSHQYQTPDIVSQLLQMIKLISLHSQVLSKAAKNQPEFISWCQHNMLVNKLWSLCQLESSEIARTCVPLLLHCITLPWGVRLFRDLVERDFNSDNWLSRFRAVERVVTIAYFCEPSAIKNSTLLQSTIASAFCYVVRCLDDIEAIVAQRALVSLEMMKTSSLKLLLWCLEVQFDFIIIDRPMILRSVFQLYNHLRDRRFLTWEFFLNRFDTIFLEAQIYLQQTGEIPSFTMQDLKNTNTKSEIYQKKIARAKEALQETHHSRSLSSRFNEKQFSNNSRTSDKLFGQSVKQGKQSTKMQHQMQQQYQQSPRGGGQQPPTSGETSQQTSAGFDKRRMQESPLKRVIQHGKSTSSRYQSVALLTSQSMVKRKNSKFMANLAMQSVPPLMLPDKLHQHLPNSFVDDGSKLNEIAQENHVFGVVHRVCDEDRDTNHSLIFLLMQFFSKPDPSHPQSLKTLTRSHQIVLRHLNILMGYSVARKNFLIAATNLRLLPVFNAFMTSLPKVLDFNYSLGTILLDTCLPILIYCPAPEDVQYDAIKTPNYSLWLLNPLMRQSWLMSVMAFLYKYQFGQDHLRDHVYKLMWIVINTLESHLNYSILDFDLDRCLISVRDSNATAGSGDEHAKIHATNSQESAPPTTSTTSHITSPSTTIQIDASPNKRGNKFEMIELQTTAKTKDQQLLGKKEDTSPMKQSAKSDGTATEQAKSTKVDTSEKPNAPNAKQLQRPSSDAPGNSSQPTTNQGPKSDERLLPIGYHPAKSKPQGAGELPVAERLLPLGPSISKHPNAGGVHSGTSGLRHDSPVIKLSPGHAPSQSVTTPGTDVAGQKPARPSLVHQSNSAGVAGQSKTTLQQPTSSSNIRRCSDNNNSEEAKSMEVNNEPAPQPSKGNKRRFGSKQTQDPSSTNSKQLQQQTTVSLSSKDTASDQVEPVASSSKQSSVGAFVGGRKGKLGGTKGGKEYVPPKQVNTVQPSFSSPSLLNEQLAQINRHSFVQEFSDKDLSMCLVILETFIHHEPSMAAQMLPNILRLVARYSSASLDSWQSGSNVHLVGGSMFVARQFIRVALHDLMENNIFHQIFTSHFTGYEFYKSMATALADFPDLNQLAPLSKLFEDLNKQKNLPQATSLMTILENVATYFECIIGESSTHSQTTWTNFITNWENFLRKLILALPRFSGSTITTTTSGGRSDGTSSMAHANPGHHHGSLIGQPAAASQIGASGSGSGGGAVNQFLMSRATGGGSAGGQQGAAAQDSVIMASANAIPSSCSMIMTPIMRIILSTSKISHLASCKTIVDPYSKIISYTVLNSQFKYEHLLEINHNCCRLYTRDREKYLIQRTIAYELVQVLKFRFFILEENLLILLLFVLQDVGGTLAPGVVKDSLKINQATLNQAESYITNVSECLRQYIGDLLEFITDVHAISRINDNLIGSQPTCINRDSFGGHVKAAISQYLALEMSLTNGGDNRTVLRYLPWLYSSPSIQQGPREFIDCVSHIRQLSWIILGSLQHSTLTRSNHGGASPTGSASPQTGFASSSGLAGVGGCHHSSSQINCQPIPIEKNANIAEHVQVILAGFAEQSKESVLHMSGLFHAFLLCQLWTMYCENICTQHPVNSEPYQFSQSTLDDFWAKITPGVLRLVSHSRVMSEMVSTHFLQLIESLIESNSSILIRYLPMWNSVFYSYKKRNKSSNLAIRLQKCIEWQPPDLSEQDVDQTNRRLINWLEKVQYKMSHIEIQSSQAAPFYLT